MITVILRVKTSLPELAAECLALMGEGARPEADNELYTFAYNNTPVENGYIRIPVAEHIAMALQWMLDTGITSEHAEIVRVEHFGQDRVPGLITTVDEDGVETTQEGYVEELFLTGTDEEGNSQYLGRMGM